MQPLSGKKILVTGGTGFLGQHVVPALKERGADVFPLSRRLGFDLTHEAESLSALLATRPDIVVHLAATKEPLDRPGMYFRNNMLMGMNIIHATAMAGARLVMLGTMESYPSSCRAPFREDDFWEGYPELEKAPYGVAKKALWVMCDAYRRQFGLPYVYLVPGNVYGPYQGETGTIADLISGMIQATEEGVKTVASPYPGESSESLVYAGDLARAVSKTCESLEHYDGILNLSDEEGIPFKTLAPIVGQLCGFTGKIKWPSAKGNGLGHQVMDGSRAMEILNWKPEISLEEGLKRTVEWHLSLRKKS